MIKDLDKFGKRMMSPPKSSIKFGENDYSAGFTGKDIDNPHF